MSAEESNPLFVGHYKIEKTLGQGSYGKVKLASNTKTGRVAAMKFIPKANMKKTSHVTRIKREVRLLQLLNHKNIVRLYEVAETNEDIILVMEYANGGELFDYIVSRHHLKESEARGLFRQLVGAVDYCHSNFIIHRDLKPENILLDCDHNIKVIDFGFANFCSTDGLLKTFCGSPFYASPEMVLGKKYVGPEVDIWSMGIILFVLLSGRLPFDDKVVKKLYEKIVLGEFVMPPDISPEAADLISRMIVVNADDRITLDAIEKHPWTLEGYNFPPTGVRTVRNIPEELDENLMKKMELYGVETELARQNIMTNPKSKEFVIYHLLKEKAKRDEDEKKKAAIEALALKGSEPNSVPSGTSTSSLNEEAPLRLRRQTVANLDISGSRKSLKLAALGSAAITAKPIGKTGSTDSSNPSGTIMPMIPAYMLNSQMRQTAAVSSGEVSSTGSLTAVSLPPAVVLPENGNTDGTPSVSIPVSRIKKIRRPSFDGAGLSFPSAPQSPRIGSARAQQPLLPSSPGPTSPKVVPVVPVMPVAPIAPGSPKAKPTEHFARPRRYSIDVANIAVVQKMRKQTENSLAPLADGSTTTLKDTGNEPREVKGLFNVSTSTSKPVSEILVEIRRVLDATDIKYLVNGYTFRCQDLVTNPEQPVQFEIEICKIHKLDLFGLNLKRIEGDSWPYKKLANKLTSKFRL